MSQVSTTRSVGNRYYLTARSLMPDTALAVVGMFAFFLITMFAFVFWNAPPFLTMFGLSCALGLGHMTCLFQTSERRRLVPGMNETCAAVAITITVAMWLFNVVMIVCQYGYVPEACGGTLLAIACGLWIGWGERRIYHAFVLLFIALFVLIATPDGPLHVYNFYRSLSTGHRSLVGLGIGLTGVGVLWRFWTLATLRIGPATFKQKRDIYSFLTTPRALPEISNAREASSGFVEESAAAPKRTSNSLATRLVWLIYGRAYFKKFHYVLVLLGFALIASMLLSARGHIEATAAFLLLATLAIFLIPLTLFLVRVPQAFARLWITGIADSRSETARQIMKLTALRTVPVFVIGFAMLSLQIPLTLNWYATVLIMLLSGVGISGATIWIVARRYAFWSSHRALATVCFTAVLGALVVLLPFASHLIPKLHEIVVSFGVLPVLLGVSLVTALIWAGCIFDGAKALGEARLGECDVNTPQYPVFTTEHS